MRTSSYLRLAKELKAKHGCLNIQNNNEKYFLWSILASLQRVQHGNHLARVFKYQKFEHELSMSGIQYHRDIKLIVNFEHQNNIIINIFGYEDKKNLPITY